MWCVCFHRLMIFQNTWVLSSLSYLQELIRFQHFHGSGHHDDAPERLAIHLRGGQSKCAFSSFRNLFCTQSIRHIIGNILHISGGERNSNLKWPPLLLRSNSAHSSFHLVLAALISPSPPSFHNPLPGVSLAFSKVVIHACKSGAEREQALRWK